MKLNIVELSFHREKSIKPENKFNQIFAAIFSLNTAHNLYMSFMSFQWKTNSVCVVFWYKSLSYSIVSITFSFNWTGGFCEFFHSVWILFEVYLNLWCFQVGFKRVFFTFRIQFLWKYILKVLKEERRPFILNNFYWKRKNFWKICNQSILCQIMCTSQRKLS